MPPDDGTLAFGDVILVPFPFTAQTRSKRRPAIVISARAYNARHPDVIVMPAISQVHADTRPDDVIVGQWAEAGLLKPSAIKPVIATLDQALIIQSMGTLRENDRRAVAAMLDIVLT